MNTQEVNNLEFNLLTEEQFKAANAAGNINNLEFYVTPDDDLDQTYNPESTKAQSGTAVAEALSQKQDKFIDNGNATITAHSFNFYAGDDGLTYIEGNIERLNITSPELNINTGGPLSMYANEDDVTICSVNGNVNITASDGVVQISHVKYPEENDLSAEYDAVPKIYVDNTIKNFLVVSSTQPNATDYPEGALWVKPLV